MSTVGKGAARASAALASNRANRAGPALPSRRTVACSVFLLAAELATASWGWPAPRPGRDHPPECRVQIASVKLGGSAIHKTVAPNATTFRVTLDVRGRPPHGATVKVEVGTYSADPPGNDLIYTPTDRDVALKPGRIAVKFSVRAGPKTLNGSVVVGASLQLREQAGVEISPPQRDYRKWRARLTTLAP